VYGQNLKLDQIQSVWAKLKTRPNSKCMGKIQNSTKFKVYGLKLKTREVVCTLKDSTLLQTIEKYAL
jgi:hypothetical protein